MSDEKPKKDWAHAPDSGSVPRPYRFNAASIRANGRS